METALSVLLIAAIAIIGAVLVGIGIRGSLRIWRKDENGVSN